MTRGRKPKATATKERSGAYRKNPQRRNAAEPKPKSGWPIKPPIIKADKVASAQWDDTCQLLDDMSILTMADLGVLISYCTTYSEWLKAYIHVRDNGVSCPTAAGGVTTSPETHQYNKLADRQLKLLAELGLTPSSRSRIRAVDAKDEENPFAEILGRMSGVN